MTKSTPDSATPATANAAEATPASGFEPFVTEEGDSRRLYFGEAYVQSEMSLEDPWALRLTYTQKMMAFLLFVPMPKHIVIVGLGGGSLTKFCHRHLPKTRITTIEIDARVIALAPRFEVPPPDARMRIVHADACDWFARGDERFDVVLLDGYDEKGVASGLGDPALYRNISAGLRSDGLLVANILVTPKTFRHYEQVISESFGTPRITLRVMPDGNNLVFAFKAPPNVPDWLAISRKAKKLKLRYGLDFPAFARAMRRAHERSGGDASAEESVSIL